MPESSVENWGMILWGKIQPLTQHFVGGLTQVWPVKFMLIFVFYETFRWLLGHLDWKLGTKDPHSDPADKTFLGLCIVSNVSKWSKLLLKMG